MNMEIKRVNDDGHECDTCHIAFDVRQPRMVIDAGGAIESLCFSCFLELCEDMAASRTEFANAMSFWEDFRR